MTNQYFTMLVISALIAIMPSIAEAQTGVWKTIDRLPFVDGFWTTLRKISAGDPSHLMTFGDRLGGDYIIRCSIDAGQSWNTVFHDTAEYRNEAGEMVQRKYALKGIATPTPRLAIITCDSGYILRSEDWGSTWTSWRLDAEKNLINISMSDSLFGIIYEYPNRIWRTTNGGAFWSRDAADTVARPEGYSVSQVQAFSPLFWLAVIIDPDRGYYIARTTDGGKHWSYNESRPVSDIRMMDEQRGCAVGYLQDTISLEYTDIVQLTEDGGATWVTVLDEYIFPKVGLSAVAFANSSDGIAVGSSTKALRTTDGGWTWLPIMNGLEGNDVISMTDVVFPTPTTAYASVAMGAVYRYDLPSSVDHLEEGGTARASLYPNPASETITLSLDLPRGSAVYIDIINTLGHRLTTMAELHMAAGRSTLPIDCSSLRSGSYFARIEAEGGIFIRKFEVIR